MSSMNHWDSSAVTYSQYSTEANSQVGESRGIEKKFREFLRTHKKQGTESMMTGYREQLSMNYNQGKYFCEVDFADLNKFDKNLAEKLRKQPEQMLPKFEKAAKEAYLMSKYDMKQKKLSDVHDIQIQIVNFRRRAETIRSLDSTMVSQLVQAPGIIISASRVSARATKMRIRCTACGTERWVVNEKGFGSIPLPRICEGAGNQQQQGKDKCPLDPFSMVPDKCEYVDTQKLKLQENPEDVPTGEMPRHLWLSVDRNFVDKVKPGSRVNIIGVYSIYSAKVKGKAKQKTSSTVRQPYLRVIGIETINATETKGSFDPEDEDELKKLAKDKEIYKKIVKSIAPAIFGREEIKKAIACLMFGGSRKHLAGGMKLRGDINVLLLGDPSVAKSQFLKFVHAVSPIAVYTSGKGSSAAGLTASVMRDPTSGEFHLEGGAMVLADGGVVCIDEFDKMREQDRISIHEAMEQQTISIAKAGITTILNSRCSVLAAANPIFGRYDDMRTVSENIDFQSTILSRFDLIFIIKDVKDVDLDKKLAHHIMDFHMNVDNSKAQEEAPIDTETIAKYLAYARKTCHPRLTPQAIGALKNHYVTFRQTAKKREEQTGRQSAIPITVRQLEAIIRISESLAKMELNENATEAHVQEAVRLFRYATMKAVQQGALLGDSAMGGNTEFIKQVQKAEEAFRNRQGVGSTAQVSVVVKKLKERNHDDSAIAQALHFMFLRGEIEFFSGRRMLRRKK